MLRITLNNLRQGKRGKVVDFNGGQGLIEKLNNLGIRKGKEIIKISNSFFGGPVTVQIDNIKIAIGNRMASKIVVEVVNDENTSNG